MQLSRLLGFQIDQPVAVRIACFRSGGVKLRKGKIWDWRRAGVDPLRVRHLVLSGVLYHPVVADRVAELQARDDLDEMNIRELQVLARSLGLETSRSKDTLRDRIRHHQVELRRDAERIETLRKERG